MKSAARGIEQEIKAFCAEIGSDPLLVQGAGGNVSWKDGSTLWVKASGKWLAEAKTDEIFVPLNLLSLQAAISKKDFSLRPELTGEINLRPSIETMLHALMPHKMVVHLHAVEILSHLVRINAFRNISRIIGDDISWVFVDYYKPGMDLAKAVSDQLSQKPDTDVVFLCNHGVLIGGDNVDDVSNKLRVMISCFRTNPAQSSIESYRATCASVLLECGYIATLDKELDFLCIDDVLIKRLRREWALYPDHVVFLGAEPVILDSPFGPDELHEVTKDKPPYIFCLNEGVYESRYASQAQRSQLRCYYDVITRQEDSDQLAILTQMQVSELLDWESEKYRQKLGGHHHG